MILVLLGGCVNTRITDQARSDLGRTGVVSLLGNSFHAMHVGTTVFNNSAYDGDASSWNIDEDTAQYVRARLSADGIQAEVMSLDPAARASFRREDHGEFHRRDNTVETSYEELCRLAARQGYDTLVVIAGFAANENGPPLEPGYGLFVRSFLGLSRGYTYAQFVIRVIDVKNESQLGRQIAHPVDAAPAKAIPWKSSLGEYSPAEQAAFRSAIEGHMRREADRMLAQLNLGATAGGS